MGGLGIVENMFVGVDCDKFNAADIRPDHAVYGVTAAATDSDNLNLYDALKICGHFKTHWMILP